MMEKNLESPSVARDVFLYLLVIVVLTMSTIALGALLFDLVNVYLPDPASSVCAYDGCAGALNTELAFLLVAFSVLFWAWRFLQRDIQAHPEKSHLTIRKWLLYLALFVAGVTVIGDLVALIRSWLGGELTTQFSLKVLAVFYIAASVFYYFLRQLHPERHGKERLVAYVAIGVVILSFIAGIYTSAPWNARDRMQDRTRVSDLERIQSQVVQFWTAKERLPQSLDELQDSISGFQAPVDPETNQSYVYNRTGTLQFTLCATFTTRSIVSDDQGALYRDPFGQGNWSHERGYVCFERTVDPDLYPPKSLLR